MSATTTVRTTRHGVATLNYCNHQAKAHNNWNMKRVLALSAGLGLTPDQAEKKMQEIWEKKGTQQKNQIEAYTIVQSFDPKKFSYKSAKDVKKVNQLGTEFASRAFAGRAFTVATQADGTHHVLHNHITICSQDPVTLKSLRGVRTSVKYTREINDEILREHGYEPIKSQNLVKADSIAMQKMREKHPEKPLKVDVIRDRLDDLMSRKDITTWDSLIKAGKKEKLDIRAKFTKQGKLSRVSYRLLDDTDELRMKKGIRPKKLGEIYGKDNIEQFLQANSKFQKDRESDREATSRVARGVTADFEANIERRAFEKVAIKHGEDRKSSDTEYQNTAKAPNRTGGTHTGFRSTTVYYPRSTSKRLKKPRNAFKRPRNRDGQLSQTTNYSYPNFSPYSSRLTQYTSEFDELKRDFKRLNSTPKQAKLWRNAIFDDDTVEDLKQLFKEYANIRATKRLRGRAHESSRADRRSTYDATNEPNELDF